LKENLSEAVLKSRQPKVWAAFVKYCNSAAWASKAVTWGHDPLIVIKELEGLTCGLSYSPGLYRLRPDLSPPPNEIWIDPLTAHALESQDDPVAFESTILHELVHWARRQQPGLDDQFIPKDPTLPGGDLVEVGKKFEEEAYELPPDTDIDCWRSYFASRK
jgi:hypothetical protein